MGRNNADHSAKAFGKPTADAQGQGAIPKAKRLLASAGPSWITLRIVNPARRIAIEFEQKVLSLHLGHLLASQRLSDPRSKQDRMCRPIITEC
ncbi:hypothetical protein CKO42_20195 [Lamprobacter modestohalophilus]|uniref:Uncharacterized protein n=1 Tax=Lamprobacter modestohalophilus TaxID=1064514 RepID=A0A9X0WBW3_9GAMM|nr:hypothetical protein [Lamprobacter modestohalophilus]